MILHPGFRERRVPTLSVVLAGLVLAVAPVIGSAGVTGSDPVVQPVHREAPDDPPAERPATPPRGVISVGPIVARGEFESVQVNVDDNGNNIPGDAANEPSIAVDPNNPNIMAIGWRQFDSVNSNFRQAGWGYSQDGGQSWTFPGVLEPGVFRSDPVLDFDSEGTFYYNSLTQNFLFDTYISTDGGVTWGDPNPAFGGDKAWMAIDRTGGMGHGHLYLPWSTAAGCCGSRIFTR
ncbi:MAG: exo-alpha-sialidase, partial [Planctomycetes bacterium]|nr:exo-alpha-sialidase [Planctomycetota bacterium]